MDTEREKQVVADGYDAIADAFAAWSEAVVDPVRDRLFDRFCDMLPTGASVLDIGCGSGVPWTRRLADRCAVVVGVDISPVQAEAARHNVPTADIRTGDVMALHMPEQSMDGVVALYATGHLPAAEHEALLLRITGWLRPGGILLASFPAGIDVGWTGEWLGAPMFFSGLGTDAYRRLLAAGDWDVLADEEALVREPDGEARFLWIIARRQPRA